MPRLSRLSFILPAVLVSISAPLSAQDAVPTPSAYAQYLAQRGLAGTPTSAGHEDGTAGALGADHGSPALAGGPNLGALPNLDQVMNNLKQNALGALKGCDYGQYMRLADDMSNMVETFKSLESFRNVRQLATPFMDIVSTLMRGAGVQATKESAKAESQSLAYQLEQVCNVVVQADEANRQYQIMKAGSFNIGGAIKFMMDEAGLQVRRVPGSQYPRLTADWAKLYKNYIPETNTAQDTMWAVVSTTLENSLKAADDQSNAIAKIEADINKASEELILLAEATGDTIEVTANGNGSLPAGTRTWVTKFICPEGYPDPHRPDTKWHRGKPVCGPASPERSVQITAHLELLKTQLKAIQMANDARMLEVEAIRLAGDNNARRQDAFVETTGLAGW